MQSIDECAPPLPRWDPSNFEFEPAHGYFVRLAEKNAAHSVRAIAHCLGLNGRNLDPEELLSFCNMFPLTRPDRMRDATPISERGFVHINGQMFRKLTDWSIVHPRVCDACLADARYYRNWWDLTVIQRCPIHDRPLIAGEGASQLAWWVPSVGVTDSGSDVALRSQVPLAARRDSWEAYVLGRIGVFEKRYLLALDGCEMHEAIAAVELVGKAARHGFQTRRPSTRNKDERYQSIVAGFYAFKEHRGLTHLMEQYIESRPTNVIGNFASPSQREWGWLYNAIASLPHTSAREYLDIAIAEVGHRFGIAVRERRLRDVTLQATLEFTPKAFSALKPLAEKFGYSTRRLRAIVDRLGLISSRARTGRYHSFGPGQIAEIESTLADLVSVKQACELTELSIHQFRKLCRTHHISAFVHGGCAAQLFRRSDLLRLRLGSTSEP